MRTAVRETRVSWQQWERIQGPLKPLGHHSTMVTRDFSGAHYAVRRMSLGQPRHAFFLGSKSGWARQKIWIFFLETHKRNKLSDNCLAELSYKEIPSCSIMILKRSSNAMTSSTRPKWFRVLKDLVPDSKFSTSAVRRD